MNSDKIAKIVSNASRRPISIRVVADENCPSCRKVGSPKVCDNDGIWHWKCLSHYEDCKIAYWVPGRDASWYEYKLEPAEAEVRARDIAAQVLADIKIHGIKVTTMHADGTVTDDSIPAERFQDND